MRLRVLSNQALALAKLGAYDEAVRLAGPLVLPLRADGLDDEARLAHLALGVGLSGLGDPAAAGRELLAAHQLLRVDSTVDDRLFIARERAVLALHGMDGTVARTVLDAIGEQARQLWQVRLQRLPVARQPICREALKTQPPLAVTALRLLPLTRL